MVALTTRTAKGAPLTIAEVDANFTNLNTGKVETNTKDASGGYPGLTLFALNLKNAANNFTNFLTNATTAARTWTLPDKDGTVALIGDVLPNIANVFINTAPNNIINVAVIHAVAPTTNAHLILLPKGTGGLSTTIPTLDKPLGVRAICLGTGKASTPDDICIGSGAATGGASLAVGFGSAIGAASIALSYAIASGDFSTALGSGQSIGSYSFAAVLGTASGMNSSALGTGSTIGFSSFSANGSMAQGAFSAAFGVDYFGGPVLGNAKIATVCGDSPHTSGMTPLQVTAAPSGVAILSSLGVMDGPYDDGMTFCLAASASSTFDISVVARSSTGKTAGWKVLGLVSVGATGAATIIGTPTVTLIGSNFTVLPVFVATNITANSHVPSSLDVTITTSGGITITAPAAATGTTVSWGATLISSEVIL